jgi:hypothetical protein
VLLLRVYKISGIWVGSISCPATDGGVARQPRSHHRGRSTMRLAEGGSGPYSAVGRGAAAKRPLALDYLLRYGVTDAVGVGDNSPRSSAPNMIVG